MAASAVVQKEEEEVEREVEEREVEEPEVAAERTEASSRLLVALYRH